LQHNGEYEEVHVPHLLNNISQATVRQLSGSCQFSHFHGNPPLCPAAFIREQEGQVQLLSLPCSTVVEEGSE